MKKSNRFNEYTTLNEEQKAMLDAWSNQLIRTKNINRNAPSSYGLKHKAEKWLGFYVSNRDMKESMERCGFVSDYGFRHGYENINHYYNISKKSFTKDHVITKYGAYEIESIYRPDTVTWWSGTTEDDITEDGIALWCGVDEDEPIITIVPRKEGEGL